jgi:hypothetical protein
MTFYKKLAKLVSMIKRYKYLLIFILLFSSKSLALSPEYEKELYIGCYTNSKQYLGTDGAKIYCQCTIDKLSAKFDDKQMDEVFSKEPYEIQQLTAFATIECENNK